MKTILIIDDQKMYLNSLAVALGKKYKVRLASDYNSALEECEVDIDIALIDIRLDEQNDLNVDGLRLLEWMKLNKPGVSTFVMSAYKEFSYAEQALNLGAKHFFKKPIDIISLIGIIEEKS
jgi:DNA-binding NtrC family response regulator